MGVEFLGCVLLLPAPASHNRHCSGQRLVALCGLITPLILQMRKLRCEDWSACSISHRKLITELSLDLSCPDSL